MRPDQIRTGNQLLSKTDHTLRERGAVNAVIEFSRNYKGLRTRRRGDFFAPRFRGTRMIRSIVVHSSTPGQPSDRKISSAISDFFRVPSAAAKSSASACHLALRAAYRLLRMFCLRRDGKRPMGVVLCTPSSAAQSSISERSNSGGPPFHLINSSRGRSSASSLSDTSPGSKPSESAKRYFAIRAD